MSEELGEFSMLELFRLEVENQANTLSDGLLSLESNPEDAQQLESLMRAAHSIKGAARMVDIEAGVKLAHAMEDCFVSAQKGEIVLQATQVDLLLKGVDQLLAISRQEADDSLLTALCEQIRNIDQLSAETTTQTPGDTVVVENLLPANESDTVADSQDNAPVAAPTPAPAADRQTTTSNEAVRVSSDSLNKLVGWPAKCR